MTRTDEQPLAREFTALQEVLREVQASRVSTFSRSTAQDAVTQFLRIRNQMDAAYLHLLRALDALTGPPRT